jgi:hypothetical protein
MTKELICFRCGKPIEGYLYVHTLSDENAHVYCQATGVKPNKQGIKSRRFYEYCNHQCRLYSP